MKKIFLFAFVAFLFLTPVVSASASIAWTPDAISGLGDLGYSLIGGASFDFKNSKYIEGAVDVDDALAEQQASQFLADYCLSRGIGLLNPDELPTSDYEYFKTYYFNSITNKAWNNYRLAQTQAQKDEALRFELSNSLFAQWTGYNKLWYKNYIDSFSDSSDVVIDPNPDPDFSFIVNENKLYTSDAAGNTIEFLQSDYPFVYQNAKYPITLQFDKNAVSYFEKDGLFNHSGIVTNRNIHLSVFDSIGTINFDTSTLTASYSNFNLFTGNIIYVNGSYYSGNQLWPAVKDYNQDRIWIRSVITENVSFRTDFSNASLSVFINYVYDHFANFNLFVDGEPWALVIDEAPANPLIPDFNDIIDKDSDDPAYDIVTPIDGVPAWFDLTSLFDAIKLAIIDAKNPSNTDDGVLDLDKVIDNDGIVDSTGDIADTTTKDIDDVLDDPIEIDKTKDYPVIPLYTPPIQNAFKGTSILAELIDGTQTVLPEELIITFWGIVFVIFILGLLNILHK